MPLVLKTKKDAPAAELAGLPRMPANGVGGVLLDVAAGLLDELKDPDGEPLEGKELEKAARAFADDRGYAVGQISDEKVEKLPELAGGFPDRPPAVAVAEARGEQLERERKRAEDLTAPAVEDAEPPAAEPKAEGSEPAAAAASES